MIDSEGYRANVGIILTNGAGNKLLWAKRVGMDAWQFPQGGIQKNEPVKDAMYRELFEETGLKPKHVKVLGNTDNWLRYDLPKKFIRRHKKPVCIGQKQIWYLLTLIEDESKVKLDHAKTPEFERWRWIDFWQPVDEVVEFKRQVYRKALGYFEPLLFT
jgi:putative (di)nucleoside polyphosphate hydrolase